MDRIRVAQELVKIAKELVGSDEILVKRRNRTFIGRVEKLGGKLRAVLDGKWFRIGRNWEPYGEKLRDSEDIDDTSFGLMFPITEADVAAGEIRWKKPLKHRSAAKRGKAGPVFDTKREYEAYEKKRKSLISDNRSRRMKGEKPLPVPPPAVKPTVWQIHDKDGDYVGTWPVGVSKRDAIQEAKSLGETVGKVTEVEPLNW